MQMIGTTQSVKNSIIVHYLIDIFSALSVGLWRNICDSIRDFATILGEQNSSKMLIQKVEEQLPSTCKIILLSAPQAVDYYPKIGLTQHNSAWVKTVGK